MAEYDNQIPLKLQLLRIGLGAGPDALGIFTYQIEGHNTNYAAPYFCIAPANYRPDTMDILDSMQETKDAILCYGTPDDLREIMGLTPQGELDQDILESDDSEYVSLDGGWYLDGQLLSFEKIPPAASDVHAILTNEQIDLIQDCFDTQPLGDCLRKAEAIANDPRYHQTAAPDRNPLHDLLTGGWRVHLVQEGEHYGVNGNLVYGDTIGSGAPHIGERINDCQLYGHGLPLVEFYDMTKDTEQGGQFVSRHYMSTLLGMDESGTPLSDMRSFSLDGGVPSWTVAGTDLQNVTDWLNTAKETLQPAVGEEPTPAPGPEEPSTYDYQLLDRLKSDCDYYLGACVDFGMDMTAAQKNLWAGNIEAQVSKMRELYDKLPEKPDWLTMQDIDRYEHDMLTQRDNTAGQKESVSLSGEAKSARDSSRALDAHAPDAPTHENQR